MKKSAEPPAKGVEFESPISPEIWPMSADEPFQDRITDSGQEARDWQRQCRAPCPAVEHQQDRPDAKSENKVPR